MAPLFEYRRSTRCEAFWKTFGLVVPLMIFTGCLLWWLASEKNSGPIILTVVAVGTLFIGVWVWYVILNLLIAGEFVVRIDKTAIQQSITTNQQSVPVRWVSDSFRVPIRDIDHVWRVVDDGLMKLVIVDRAGNQFKLETNYGNPCSQIADVLESLNVSVR